MRNGEQDQENRTPGEIMMTHKHHTFQHLDKMPKAAYPEGGKLTLSLYLKAIMHWFVAENKLQQEMKGDETEYCNMLAEEYIAA
jgi:hypothetical protein